MKATSLLLLLCLWAASSHSDEVVPTALIRTDISYATLEFAVQGELRKAMLTSGNRRIEIGGVIYERAGNFYPSTWLEGDEHSIPKFQFGMYRDTTIAAIWHTHPSPILARSNGFSATDAKSAYGVRADAYVGVIVTDIILRLRFEDIKRGEHNTFYSQDGEVTDL